MTRSGDASAKRVARWWADSQPVTQSPPVCMGRVPAVAGSARDVPLTYVYSDQDSYDPLARIDGVDAPEIFWFHCQPNGTPERMTDSEGQVRWKG